MIIKFSKKLATVATTALVLAACGGGQTEAESPDADMAAEDEEMGLDESEFGDEDLGDEDLGDDEFGDEETDAMADEPADDMGAEME